MSVLDDTPELGGLPTESVRAELADLDLLETGPLVELIANDAARALEAVRAATPAIAAAVELVAGRLGRGGRLVYVGAGTAGRLAILDAAELGPTFSVPDGLVEGVIAGGDRALRHAIEGAEDDAPSGAAAMERLAVGDHDAVVGVSASGRTPFVLGALGAAATKGAATVCIACNRDSEIAAASDVAVELLVGGEIIAGSSRMNAGTAQKIALNTISTAVMVRLGKTYGNLMVDLRATNAKLRDRAVRIVVAITGADAKAARQALERADWNVKLAVLLVATGERPEDSIAALELAGGRLREALEALRDAPPDA